MLALKIPLAMLLYIVWYAIRATPEPYAANEDDGGIGHRPDRPRPRSPAPRRRGPHGEPIPAPPRTRTPAFSRDTTRAKGGADR